MHPMEVPHFLHENTLDRGPRSFCESTCCSIFMARLRSATNYTRTPEPLIRLVEHGVALFQDEPLGTPAPAAEVLATCAVAASTG